MCRPWWAAVMVLAGRACRHWPVSLGLALSEVTGLAEAELAPSDVEML